MKTPNKHINTNLDIIFRELSGLSSTYTSAVKDPIDEKYMELIEDLRVFMKKVNIHDFVE